jgi:hypothetical protein
MHDMTLMYNHGIGYFILILEIKSGHHYINIITQSLYYYSFNDIPPTPAQAHHTHFEYSLNKIGQDE